MGRSLRDTYPFRLRIGSDDLTFLLDNGFTFASVDPGGYESASFSVPRDMPQTLRGQPVLLTSGLQTAFEGRVSQITRSLGNRTAIVCEGNAGMLKDAAGSMVFVDRDLTKWISPSYTRQAALVTANKQLGSTQVAADPTSNTPSLVQAITDSWASPWIPICESWYDSGPDNLISQVYYDLIVASNAVGSGFQEYVGLSSDANATTTELTANLNSASEQKAYFAPATDYRFALLQHLNTTTNQGGAGAQYNGYWHNLAVYGNHGLTGRGSDPVGFYPSDIVGWVLSQIGGLQAGVIQATDASGYVVPHSVYYTPVTLDTIVADMALVQGWHWGVWESLSPLTGNTLPRLDFRPRPSPGAFTASCRRQDCDTLDIREDLAQQYNVAVVNFAQVDGTPGSVTVTADNPILDQAGIVSRTVVFNGGTMTPATATLFGAEALALVNAQARVAGSADIISAIDGPGAPWLLKPGVDRLRVVDLPSVDAFGAYNDLPLTRMECSVSSSGINTSVEFGTGAQLIETLNARLAAATQLAGNGGA